MRKSFNVEAFEPIPTEQRKDWEAFIVRSKAAAKSESNSKFQLVLLAGELTTKYGEKTLQRWAEEIGIGLSSARHYRMLASRGVDAAFIKRYAGVSYTVIRDVVFHCGGVTNAEYFLEYAKKHKLGVVAINAFMRDSAAPPEMMEDAKAALMAIRTKQSFEGFSDNLRAIMESIIEEHPELEKTIMETRMVKAEDLDKILVQAGIKSNEEQRMVDKAKRQIDRVRKDMAFYKDNGSELIESVEHNHEASQELYDKVKYLYDYLRDILEHKPKQYNIQSKDEIVVDINSKKKA